MTLRTHGSVVSWTVGAWEQTCRPSGLRPSQPQAATSAPPEQTFLGGQVQGPEHQAFRGLTARGHGRQLMGREGVSADLGLVGPPHSSLQPPSPGFAPGRPPGPLTALALIVPGNISLPLTAGKLLASGNAKFKHQFLSEGSPGSSRQCCTRGEVRLRDFGFTSAPSWGSGGKESICWCRRLGFDPSVGNIP